MPVTSYIEEIVLCCSKRREGSGQQWIPFPGFQTGLLISRRAKALLKQDGMHQGTCSANLEQERSASATTLAPFFAKGGKVDAIVALGPACPRAEITPVFQSEILGSESL